MRLATRPSRSQCVCDAAPSRTPAEPTYAFVYRALCAPFQQIKYSQARNSLSFVATRYRLPRAKRFELFIESRSCLVCTGGCPGIRPHSRSQRAFRAATRMSHPRPCTHPGSRTGKRAAAQGRMCSRRGTAPCTPQAQARKPCTSDPTSHAEEDRRLVS